MSLRGRYRRIFRHAKEDVDVVAIVNGTSPHIDQSFYYITGLTSGIFEGSAAFLYRDMSVKIVTSLLEKESAKRADLPLKIFKTGQERRSLFRGALRGTRTVGINGAELTHRSYQFIEKVKPKKARIVDISQAIIDARTVKDAKEIKLIRKACRIASEVAEEIIPFIDVGVREYELAAEIDYMMEKKGATGPAFETIPASGPNSAEAHYTAMDRTLQKGDFVLLDFGAKYKKYVSDMTRTYFLGKASKKQKEIYEIVLKAQQKAMRKIKEGVKGKSVHETARRHIDRTRYKGRFTHGLGHSIGLSVHDGSALSPGVDVTLKKGMVFTVEPGIYLPGYGGVRIEDDILVTKDGCEVLTTASRELIEL